MHVKTALAQGTSLLEEARIPAARLTAEVLLSHALKRDRTYLYTHPEDELTEVAWIHYGRYLHERLAGCPTQYIVHKQEFYGRDFDVTPDVLIPRPETELVVAAALCRLSANDLVVDVGCGSGAIAATIALESTARVLATDVSGAALLVAQKNCERLGAPVRLLQCDLISALAAHGFDMVVSNPPYIPAGDRDGLQREVRDYEPAIALFAGPTGNEIYQRLIRDAERVLRPGGWLVLELGYRSEEAVRGILGSAWSDVIVDPDLAGVPRILSAKLAA